MKATQDQIGRISKGVMEYMKTNSELLPPMVFISEETFQHVVNIGTNIMMTKWEISPYTPGDFVRCLVGNDLTGTFGRADSINKKCIEFYVTMMYNLRYID